MHSQTQYYFSQRKRALYSSSKWTGTGTKAFINLQIALANLGLLASAPGHGFSVGVPQISQYAYRGVSLGPCYYIPLFLLIILLCVLRHADACSKSLPVSKCIARAVADRSQRGLFMPQNLRVEHVVCPRKDAKLLMLHLHVL